MKIIDSHVHLFDLAQGDYHWLKPENPPFWQDKKVICKNFGENDLTLTAPLELAGFVHIEAGFNNDAPWQEIKWLEQTCKKPFRSIAGINIMLPTAEFQDQMTQLCQYRSVTGGRHILDEQALEVLTTPQVRTNFALLNKYNFCFDIQMPFSDKKTVAALCQLASEFSNISFIITHAGFPPTTDNINHYDNLWSQNIRAMAQYQNVAIKCSGWEMFDRGYQKDWINLVINQCINAFGSSRVMLASNFPLTLFSTSYPSYWQQLISLIPENLVEPLTYSNANEWYKFS